MIEVDCRQTGQTSGARVAEILMHFYGYETQEGEK